MLMHPENQTSFNIEFNMKEFRSSWIFLYFVGVVNFVNGESYIPKFVEGTPAEGAVLRMAPPDLRKEDLYRIEHKVFLLNKNP